MSLEPSLCGVLMNVVEDLLNSSLPYTDYGTYHHRSWLVRDAGEVLTFLNERIQQRTDGTYSVVRTDRRYGYCSGTGLSFACVPTGEDASSHNARYFGVVGR